ncbi:MAG: efflux RND transporter permease subunit [Vicinamibacterales bacterium]
MIDAIIELSARNRFVVFVVVAVATVAGIYSMRTIPLDAIPDSSDTQVIVYSRWDCSPDIVEDQVTYPIVTAMLGAPRVKAVRGFSDFGSRYVYIVFDEGTDIYWARARTSEDSSNVLPRLPQGVRTELGLTRAASAGCSNMLWSTRPAVRASTSCAPIRIGTFATT